MCENNKNNTDSAKQWKRVPFDLELAKKITSGEVEGRIVTDKGASVRILCYDFKCGEYNIGVAVSVRDGERFCCISKNGLRSTGEHMNDGWFDKLLIELSEKAPKQTIHDCDTDCDISQVYKQSREHDFKIGDKVKVGKSDKTLEILNIEGEIATLKDVNSDSGTRYAYLIDTLFHINENYNFKPFDKVLVRNVESEIWRPSLYAREDVTSHYRYECIGCKSYHYCIPYEGNEKLVGTTDKPENLC